MDDILEKAFVDTDMLAKKEMVKKAFLEPDHVKTPEAAAPPRNMDPAETPRPKDGIAKKGTDALQFPFQRNPHRKRSPDLALRIAQHAQASKVVLATAYHQPLMILAFLQGTRHRIVVLQGHPDHRLALRVTQQGSQAIGLVSVQNQDSDLVTAQRLEIPDQALVVVEQLAMQIHRRQVSISRAQQLLRWHGLTIEIAQEKISLPTPPFLHCGE